MTQVTISSTYQVVIPKAVREQIPLHTGQKLTVVVKEGMIALLPARSLSTMRGFLRGMHTTKIREKSDRL